MGAVKRTIVVDEKTWNEFKKSVSSIYGSSRKTNLAVEEAIRCFNAAELLKSFSNAMGLDVTAYPSIKEVEERRPKLKTSATEKVRKMRNDRQTRILGLEQHHEETH